MIRSIRIFEKLHFTPKSRLNVFLKVKLPNMTEAHVNWKKINHASSSTKLFTLEELHIRKDRPAINTRDEYKNSEL